MRRILTAALVTGLILLVMYLLDSKRTKVEELNDTIAKKNEEVKVAHEREEALRQEKDEEIATLRGEIDSTNTVLSRYVERARKAEASAAARAEENERLRAEVQPVIDANPKLRSYIDNLHIEISDYKDTITNLRAALGQAQEREALYLKQTLALQETIESWKRQYENERGFRTALESAFAQSQIALRKEQAKRKWIAAAAGIGGALLGSWIH